MSDTSEDRPLETLVEKEREMDKQPLNDSGKRANGSDDISSLTQQMEELKQAMSSIASTLTSQVSSAKDAAGSTLDQVASQAKEAASTTAETLQSTGDKALAAATEAAKTVTQTKRKAQREVPGFETLQTVATVAPIAATVARRVPGGRKIVIAGSVAYGAYLLLDALSRKDDDGDAA